MTLRNLCLVVQLPLSMIATKPGEIESLLFPPGLSRFIAWRKNFSSIIPPLDIHPLFNYLNHWQGCDTAIAAASAFDVFNHVQGYWMRADPVHLQESFSGLFVTRQPEAWLSFERADAIIDNINSHFQGGPSIQRGNKAQEWYINTESELKISTVAPYDSVRLSYEDAMPSGEDKTLWIAYINEVTMLLSQMAINLDINDERQMPVRALWLWGEGCQESVRNTHFNTIWSRHSYVRGVAKKSMVTVLETVPQQFASWSSQSDYADHANMGQEQLLFLDYREQEESAEAICQHLKSSWLAPLHRAQKCGQIGNYRIVIPGVMDTERFPSSLARLKYKFSK